MIFIYSLLNEFVDLNNVEPKELINRLTFSGFEVESSYPTTKATKVVSGYVLECVNHPDSDHLHCLKVDLGPKFGVNNIVCGAPNVAKGEKVIVALPGCKLDAINEIIKPGVIRGQESNGMCCSLIELGIDKNVLPEDEKNGIHILPSDFPIGDENVLEHLGLKDFALDINVLPNRPDCLSYYGMAHEISSLMGLKLKEFPKVDLSNLPDDVSCVSQTNLCPKFDLLTSSLGKEINLEVSNKIRNWLWLSSMNSVSPLVDLGNFMMLVTGNPFHIYDLDKANTNVFKATQNIKGKFKALNGQEYEVIEDDIVIVDENDSILSIAGIMGGEASKDDENTKNIAVEAATFYHSNIRHTSNRLGLSSASSILFGKGVNPNLVTDSISSFAYYLKLLFPQANIKSFSNFEGEYKKPSPFFFSLEKLNHRLGTTFTEEEVNNVFKAYNIERVDDNKILGPIYRSDLNEQADIDEEVFRYYPADRVVPSYTGLPLTEGSLTNEQKQEKNIREYLLGKGLDEILTFTLISKKQEEMANCFYDGIGYKITNPLTLDHEYIRTDLIPCMLEIMDKNISHSNKDLSLFEISNIDTPKGNFQLLCIGLIGEKNDMDLFNRRAYDFYDLKALIDGILSILGINESRTKLVRSDFELFHPGKSANLFVGKDKVATFGELTPAKFDLPYLIAEIDLTKLFAIRTSNTKFVPFNQYPVVRRDLSFDILKEFDYNSLKLKAKGASKGLLKNILLFDYYINPKTNQKSIGVALYIGSDEKTLKEEEINNEVNEIVNVLVTSLPISLRK